MNLSNIFYIIGIIYMSLYTLLLISVVILLFYIKNKISDMYEKIEGTIKTTRHIVTHPKQTAREVGEAVTDTAITEAAKILRPKKKRR